MKIQYFWNNYNILFNTFYSCHFLFMFKFGTKNNNYLKNFHKKSLTKIYFLFSYKLKITIIKYIDKKNKIFQKNFYD